ncbi:hypothetical protein JG688_00007209 [Phytophthora aleatoria]|uniref:FAD/NAD(P)-binding domain-containing protein n=1 Tax=Phytophthora aleatoria TaxID=2496075 RepID=A0A8J5MGF8_9STRA|nr:hypothetical protein JG688_00007209 [Phytophthora aleatoria]
MVLLRHALRVAVITDSKILQRTLHTNGMDRLRPLWQKRWPMLSKASYTNEGMQGDSDTIQVAKRQQAVQSDNYQLVIVGTGWAGYQMFTECSKHLADIEKSVGGRNVDIVVVSMRNHFLYTPLLASTTVGTLEFQSITEPIRDGMFRQEGNFHLATVKEIDPEKKELFVKSALGSRREYPIKYETLVLACGSRPLTFGLPGVEEHAFFLKEIHHAQKSATGFWKTSSKRGNILTNQYCQVLGAAEVEKEAPFGMPRRSNVFSIGDCAEILDYSLPATAQKAQTQADYLTALMRGKNSTPAKPYIFRSKGMMAYLGSYQGLFEARPHEDGKITLTGWQAWFLWRSAYLTKLGSWRLRLQVPLDWLKAFVVGRDVSRF